MKQLNVTFDDKDYKNIIKEKKFCGLNWREFILNLVALHKIERENKK